MAKTFLGGIKIKRNPCPYLTADLEQPSRIVLTVASARPLAVKEGDVVRRGSLVAPTYEGSAAIFSGIYGVVTAVTEESDAVSLIIEAIAKPTAAEGTPVTEALTEEEAPMAEASADAVEEAEEERPAEENAVTEESAPTEERSAEEVTEESAPTEEESSEKAADEAASVEERSAEEVTDEATVTEERSAEEVTEESAPTEEESSEKVADEVASVEERSAEEVTDEATVTEERSAGEVTEESAPTEEESSEKAADEAASVEEEAPMAEASADVTEEAEEASPEAPEAAETVAPEGASEPVASSEEGDPSEGAAQTAAPVDGPEASDANAALSADTAAPFPIPDKPLAALTEEELRTLLLDRGVTPPPPHERAMKCLVVDCSGDDPYNESRASVTYAHTGEVVGGAKILMKLLGVRRCLFAVSRAHLDMANQLESYTTTFSSMLRVAQVKAKYPQSEPHLLVSALFNVEINSGVPMEKTGYAVVTPILCKAVFDALGKGIPFTHTAVTVAQEALRPKTTFVLSVPLGTELGEMVSLLNLRKVKWDRLTVGGGYRAVPAEADAVITPDTEAVTLMRPRKKEKVSLVSCMGCGRCEEACPLHLLPDRLYEAVMRDDRRLADWLTYDECNGCLSCSAICPARLPLGEAIVAYQSLPTEEVSDEA